MGKSPELAARPETEDHVLASNLAKDVAQLAAGMPPPIATLARIAKDVLAAQKGSRMPITEFKRNPGKVLASVQATGPQRLGDTKSKDGVEAMLLPTEDASLLAEAVVEMLRPRHATGQDLYQRFARDRRASAVSVSPPPEEDYAAPSLRDLLGRTAPE